jgi:pimeloyl-ACP methyl ester carboxylesterase
MFRKLLLVLGLVLASLAAVPLAPAAGDAAAAFEPTRFSVTVVGSGPDVILIPGLTASREIWDGTIAAVPGYRYHLVQVAGFAGAPAAGNAKGEVVAPLAEEIARYIKANRLRRPFLVGHSMGGTVAMMVAARHPGRVGKLMVVDMLPQPAGLVGASAAGVKGLADALRDLSDSPAGRDLVQGAIRMFGGEQPDTRRSDPDVVARATHDLAVTDLTGELASISAPLTVVYASPNRRSGPSFDRTYAAAYAGKDGAKLVRIDRSGHMIMYDQPNAFYGALRDFLTASPGGGRPQ